ncbi:tRNA (N6-threonylcarbamoyladenosine(37)-N6)-methyltransferase TrmO [Veronia nyctiphanis]|uniref:tRNA (N6-threonylcarbamoyladenosine(37)-N6)-methyltransferase TrmO n=1 Tax=Veronia nyctiphanis TaxID=1278244 RepID=A0A4Q0YN32_9GAMM|nr:SAM-dependent methyltransferase [Veronia nyctiphanis]RXJ71863.1 tRNA (N6-threonylcarbamoyladenosine(37)-N6)-methyltransferase TrmO [Veronia nyctiphanis]
MGNITIAPIGYVKSTRVEAVDDDWDQETSYIELDSHYESDALSGLSEFSHIEVIFFFNKVDKSNINVGSRHPRNNSEWPKVGIFAQRGKNRPNRLGVTICRVVGVDKNKIYVQGLDAIDNTPVIDIKPVMAEFLPRGTVAQPEWSKEIMSGYWGESTDQ